MVTALIAAGCLALLCFLHPFVTYPLSLLLLRLCCGAREIAQSDGGGTDSVAICFCAYNEESGIEAKIQNLLLLRRDVPNLEILAYVDGATDRTGELLLRHGDQVKLFISRERRGKTHGMNVLTEMCKASILVFTDANVLMDAVALTTLLRYFADGRVGCVCGHVVYTNASASPIAAVNALYWRLEESIKQLESDTGSVIGAHGAVYAVRRDLRPLVPEDVIDDFYVSMSIMCGGYRVVRAPDVLGHEAALTMPSDEFDRKVRIACQGFNVHRLLWPRLRRMGALPLYKYTSHKLLRWLSICTLGAAGLCFAGAGALIGGPLLTICLTGVAAGGLHLMRRRSGGRLSYVPEAFAAFVATGWGIWLSLRGEKFQIWTSSSSLRN
jgi:cellulose synthase/poly-beta-1,6-N-acetylglucosamine synthase-like glycosyltransferase